MGAPGPLADLSPSALRVLDTCYLRRDASRRVIETPTELFERVARAVSQAELVLGTAREADRWQETFGRLLTTFDFLPNSPALMNAGTSLGQLAACFVVPVEDSMESIFAGLRAMALVQRTGGGTGFSFSHLRPRGDVVGSTGGEASGPVSFMRVFDCATENIKLGGRRRGANMGVPRVTHPDILEFIEAKQAGEALENFNLSVGVTDAFMEAVRAKDSYDLIHPGTHRGAGRRQAREVFDRIVEAAWQTGDPGMLYLDRLPGGQPPRGGPHGLPRIRAAREAGPRGILHARAREEHQRVARILSRSAATSFGRWASRSPIWPADTASLNTPKTAPSARSASGAWTPRALARCWRKASPVSRRPRGRSSASRDLRKAGS